MDVCDGGKKEIFVQKRVKVGKKVKVYIQFRKNYSKMKIVNYLKETYDELVRKVSWPSAKDLQSSVLVVSIASLIIALIVFLMDALFNAGMGLLFPTI